MSNNNIAIDGPAGAGKSTKELSYFQNHLTKKSKNLHQFNQSRN